MSAPLTPIYGFPFEQPPFGEPEVPGNSLHGGITGDELILAEQVENELNRVETDHDERLTELEDRPAAWLPISQGFVADVGSSPSIPIPPGDFGRIRLSLVGTLNEEEYVRVRVNDDDTSGHHTSMVRVEDVSGNVIASGQSGITTWRLAQWATASGNTAYCEIYRTAQETQITFEGGGTRIGGGIGTSRRSVAWGRTASATLLSSLVMYAGVSTTTFTSLRWWVEGRMGA